MRGKPEPSARQRWSFRARAVLVVTMLMSLASTVGIATSVTAPSTSGATTVFSAPYGAGRLMAVDPSGGYWTTTWSGSIEPRGGAPDLGSPASSNIHPSQPILGMASTPDGRGYWLVASDGGIFTFGDAPFYGSTGSIRLNQPVMGMASTPDGRGYWLVASDGGIFAYGDAPYYGSTGAIRLNQPVMGMASTPDGRGYWLVASDGGIFAFGDAPFYGSTGSIRLNQPIVGMASTPDGRGYWLVASDGGIFTFGDAPFYGSLGGTGLSALGMTVTPSQGYSIVTTDGNVYAFSSSTPLASTMTTGSYAANIQGGAPQADCAPAQIPAVTPDQSLDSVFANQVGPGWIGADATYSTALPYGRVAFDFSDTIIGTAQSNGRASIVGMPHNSELTGTLPHLAGDYAGSYGAPEPLIPDAGNSAWQVAATYMENGNQLVFVNEFAPVAGSPFDTYTGRSGIAVMSLSSGMPTLSSLTLIPSDPNTQWGNALTQSGGYDYIYGIDAASGSFYGMKVARVPVGQSLNSLAWTYWNGSQWVPGEGSAVPVQPYTVLTGVIPLANNSGFMAVSVPGGVYNDKTVDLSFACSPAGPWSSPQAIYSIPQVYQYPDEIAYIPTFHPEISSGGGLVISYNINTTAGLPVLESNIHSYQPQFLLLGS